VNHPDEGYGAVSLWDCPCCDWHIYTFNTPARQAGDAWIVEWDAKLVARESAEHLNTEHPMYQECS